MSYWIAHACGSQEGDGYNGRAGDAHQIISQRSHIDEYGEVRISQFYWESNYGGAWAAFRPPNTLIGLKVAAAAEAAAMNSNIGYSQNTRTSAENWCAAHGNYWPGSISSPVNCDCSSLVHLCMKFAGLNPSNFRTASMASILPTVGYQRIPGWVTSDTLKILPRGTVLVSRKNYGGTALQGHTVVFLGSKYTNPSTLKSYSILSLLNTGGTGGLSVSGLITDSSIQYMFNFIYSHLKNGYGAAGLLGNIEAESTFKPFMKQKCKNAHDNAYTWAQWDGYCKEYANQVDSGIVSKAQFIQPTWGYGLCGWTTQNRKSALYDYVVTTKKTSIANTTSQLEFMIKELRESFPEVYSYCQIATSAASAAEKVMAKYEVPKSWIVGNVAAINARKQKAERLYQQYMPSAMLGVVGGIDEFAISDNIEFTWEEISRVRT